MPPWMAKTAVDGKPQDSDVEGGRIEAAIVRCV